MSRPLLSTCYTHDRYYPEGSYCLCCLMNERKQVLTQSTSVKPNKTININEKTPDENLKNRLAF